MTFAQLNVSFPAALEKPGWAWSGCGDEVEANALGFVTAQTLNRVQASWQDSSNSSDDAVSAAGTSGYMLPPSQDGTQEDPLAAKIKATPGGAEALEATSKAMFEELQDKQTLRGKPMPTIVRVPDPELSATSSAVRVWRQQIELVEIAALQVLQATQQDSAAADKPLTE